MKDKLKKSLLYVAFFCSISTELSASPGRQSNVQLTIQEFRAHLHDLQYRCHGQKVEIDLLNEKIITLEKAINAYKQEIESRGVLTISCLESRLSSLEKKQEGVTQDLAQLKQNIEKSHSYLAACQSKVGELEKLLTSDISSLKQSLQSMLSLLHEEDASIYTVLPGDSLGEIALKHKVTVKAIKMANQLKNDTIFAGQKLKLPQPS